MLSDCQSIRPAFLPASNEAVATVPSPTTVAPTAVFHSAPPLPPIGLSTTVPPMAEPTTIRKADRQAITRLRALLRQNFITEKPAFVNMFVFIFEIPSNHQYWNWTEK